MKAGDKLALWYVSGNRDEAVFDEPDRFDVRRQPNPHQGFGGGGRHFCLGAGLARLELKLWIEETLDRFAEIELDGETERVSSTFLNQYRSIPVALRGLSSLSASRRPVSGRLAAHRTATGFRGEPVPPMTRSGAARKRNSQRPSRSHAGTRSSNWR